jgi:hypothetical protein
MCTSYAKPDGAGALPHHFFNGMYKKIFYIIILGVLCSLILKPYFGWKHFSENTFVHFEMDYPRNASPQISHDDTDAYAVLFGDEVSVSVMPALEKTIDAMIQKINNPSSTFSQKIMIDDYEAAEYSDGTIFLIAEGRQYTFSFFSREQIKIGCSLALKS